MNLRKLINKAIASFQAGVIVAVSDTSSSGSVHMNWEISNSRYFCRNPDILARRLIEETICSGSDHIYPKLENNL
jgi:hypothetical protein